MKKQVIYYKIEKGRIKVDRFTTYINNHDWVLPVVVILGMIATGLIEGM